MTISVIICAYADERWVELCAAVRSVRRQFRPADQIVVVIDHNPTLLARAQQELPDLTVVSNTQPRGLSGARNCGIAAASGQIVAFLDDDAVAKPDWLARLAAGYTDPRVLAVGGAIRPRWSTERPHWFPEEFDWVVGCTYRGLPTTTAPVRNLIGANMSLRRSVFSTIGGFEHGIGRLGSLPFGCEETELCIRLRQHWPTAIILYEPAAVVDHLVPATRATWRYFARRCFAEGISKARVTRLVGRQDGLSSERGYTFKTLPRGIMRGLGRGLSPVAIVVGLGLTITGYLRGQLSPGV